MDDCYNLIMAPGVCACVPTTFECEEEKIIRLNDILVVVAC